MNFRALYFSLLLIIGVSLSAFSQTDTIGVRTLAARMAKRANERPFEKVYMHFDKPYYALGDTAWFKAYVTIDIHQPSKVSKIVYVDVVSSQDSIVQSLKLQVTGGEVAFGNVVFNAPDYKQGNYHFRAYTTWMRNEDPAYFFNKEITVGNPNKTISTSIQLSGATKANTSKVTVKVAYKDANGKPYANRKVSWKAANDDETLQKGKGVTNANGVLDLSFTTNKTAAIATASLVTEINVTEDKTVTNSFSLTHAVDQPDVQFFAEGGDLINGVKTKVAFKAIRPDGLGVDIKGTITDNTGAVVAEIPAQQHLGMGVFPLVPQIDKTYKANITFPDGTQASYNLPKVQADGIGLSLVNTDATKLNIRLAPNAAFLQKNKGRVFSVVATVGQAVCWAANTKPLVDDTFSTLISKSLFPSGIVKITILNDHGEPIAERIAFILRDDLLNLNLKTAQANYAPRQKVTMDLTAMAGGKPSQANLSVAVIDETKVPYDDISETTILTNLLLTSELKGYVEKPNYYFIHPDEKTAADMDVLMLTQGYRRIQYADIVANRSPVVAFPPEQGISITGTIRNNTGLPIARGNVTMIVGDRKSSINTIANAVGEFKFTNLMYADSTKLTINGKNNPNSNFLMIMLDNATFQKPTINVNTPNGVANIDSAMNSYMENSKKIAANSHVLKEVVIKSTVVEKKPSHLDYPSLTGLSMDPDQTISGDRFSACPFIAECLQSAAFGLTYIDYKLYVSRSYNQGDKRQVSIYYNGMAVDYNFLQTLKSEEVENIEVFMNDGLSGINKMDNTNGVVVINGKVVKHTQMSKEDIKAILAAQQYGTQNLIFRGYTQPRVFYSPKYDPTRNYSLGSDLRSTIYWNPKILTDKDGKATFDLFNADSKGSYRAIIEGIDGDGNIGRTIYHYTVQ